MIQRIIFGIIGLVIVFMAPWWVVFVIGIIGAILFPWYIEIIFFGIIIDVLYGNVGVPWYQQLVHTIRFFPVVPIIEFMKRRFTVRTKW